MPDFDIDFCQERRSESHSLLSRQYGAESVAMIIHVGHPAGPKADACAMSAA